MNLVGMAAQRFSFDLGPTAGIPKTDGLIAGGGDQSPAIIAERQMANPTDVSIETVQRFPGGRVPDANGRIFKAGA